MAWVQLAAAGIGAAAGIYGSKQAGDAAEKGSKKAIKEQKRQYDTGMAMLEPQRYVGYQALGDLANLYGYGMSGYTPYNQMGASGGGDQRIEVEGRKRQGGGGSSTTNALIGGALGLATGGIGAGLLGGAVGGLFGGGEKRAPPIYGGEIDTTLGVVNAEGKGSQVDQYLTEYLRTGVWDPRNIWDDKHEQRYGALRESIDKLRGRGWAWDAAAGRGSLPGQIAPTQPGQPGNMSRFFTSPDYTFRRDEGIRGIEQGAAARGGALSGNALRAVSGFNSNLASGEFGNYFERLARMAGYGGAATNQAVGLGQSTANNIGGLYQDAANTRASGILGGYNSAANALNNFGYNWMYNKRTASPYQVPDDIKNFQYPFGG